LCATSKHHKFCKYEHSLKDITLNRDYTALTIPKRSHLGKTQRAGKLARYTPTEGVSIIIIIISSEVIIFFFFFLLLLLTNRLTWHLVRKLQGHVTNKKKKTLATSAE